jgi:uncharacterized protein YbaR (Trm112 family)
MACPVDRKKISSVGRSQSDLQKERDQPPSACQSGPWAGNDPQLTCPVDRKRISSVGRSRSGLQKERDQLLSVCQSGPWTENDPQMACPVDRKKILGKIDFGLYQI